jgi:hypothetical protein
MPKIVIEEQLILTKSNGLIHLLLTSQGMSLDYIRWFHDNSSLDGQWYSFTPFFEVRQLRCLQIGDGGNKD